MFDASNLGVVCVKIRKVSELKLIIDNLNDDLVLKTDLLIGEKLLDEGKQMGLIGKEVVESLVQLEAHIKEHHVLNGQGRYDPAIDLSFLNMSNMKDSCKQLKEQMRKQDEEKRRKEQEDLQAQMDEEDLRENQQLLQEAGDLSYKVPTRDWVAPNIQEEFHPKPLPSDEPLKINKTERRITRYMTAEPDDKGIVKVYIDDPDVANASKENISVSFSMRTYTVRVKSSFFMLLRDQQSSNSERCVVLGSSQHGVGASQLVAAVFPMVLQRLTWRWTASPSTRRLRRRLTDFEVTKEADVWSIALARTYPAALGNSGLAI